MSIKRTYGERHSLKIKPMNLTVKDLGDQKLFPDNTGEEEPAFKSEPLQLADRTRQKVEGFDGPNNLNVYVHDPETPGGIPRVLRTVDVTQRFPRVHQVIRDVPKWRRNKDSVDSDCVDWKRSVSIDGFLPWWRDPAQDLYTELRYGTGAEHRLEYVPTLALVQEIARAVPEVVTQPRLKEILKSFGVDAYHESQSGWTGPKLSLYQGFSLPVFLYELTELLNLIGSYRVVRLAQRARTLFGSGSRWTERARELAGERLAREYGMRLFIKDVERMISIFKTWKQRADGLFEHQGSIQKSRRPPIGNLFGSDAPTEYARRIQTPIMGLQNSHLVVHTKCSWQANQTLAWNYSLREFKTGMSRLFQLLDSFGVNINAAIVWEATSFTFVIDWFINVGSYLQENWNKSWIEADIKLLSLCNSAHVNVEHRVVLQYETGSVQGGDLLVWDNYLFQTNYEYYRRVKAPLPVFDAPKSLELQLGSWKLNRVINATALGIQVVFKRRNVAAYLAALKKALRKIGIDPKKDAKTLQRALRTLEKFVYSGPLRDSAKEARLQKKAQRSLDTLRKEGERLASKFLRDKARAGRLNAERTWRRAGNLPKPPVILRVTEKSVSRVVGDNHNAK